MNRKRTILHFIVSFLLLLITIYQGALMWEGGDSNAASMYLVVYWFVAGIFWLISYFTIVASLKFFETKNLLFVSFLLPSVIFSIITLCINKKEVDMLWALTIVSSIVNIGFYFVLKTRFSEK